MEGGNYVIDLGDLLARFCLSFVFVWSGVSKALHPAAGKAEVAALGLPDAALFLWLTVACQICGGLMVLLGLWARLGGRAYLFMTLIRIAFDYAPAEMNASTLPGAAIELRLSQPTQAARFPERISARVQGWQ